MSDNKITKETFNEFYDKIADIVGLDDKTVPVLDDVYDLLAKAKQKLSEAGLIKEK